MRDLKPHVIEQVRGSRDDAFDVPLCFDRNKKVFFVRYELERVEHTDLKECRKLGIALLDKVEPYKWEPFIEVVYLGDGDSNTHFGGYVGETFHEEVHFTFRRFERSRHPTQEGKFVVRWHPLDKPTSYEKQVREWSPPTGTRNDRDRILPYDEATWAGLLAIQQGLRDIRGKLHKLVMTRQLAGKLKAIGTGKQLLLKG